MEVGNLPYTAPTYWGGGGPGWSGYCITLPWQVYRQYGDTRILERNLQTIERWLAFVETKATNDLLRRYGGQWDFLGDWLWPGAKGVNGDTVETLFLNNCIWLYQLQTAARIAEAVGRPDLALRWRERAEAVRATAHRRFFNPEDNSYVNGLQSYLAIALYVDLPPAELRPGVWRRLEKEILDVRQGHIWAGITGGAFLFSTLMANDRNDLVYAMAGQEEYPGWGHMLKQGATTMWEDWEGRQSLLHSSYLYVGAWFIEGLAGIKPDLEAPGFRHIIIRPALSCREHLKRVKGAYNCIYGRIESGWETKSDRLVLNVTVPPNTRAKLCLPDSLEGEIHESGKSLETIGYSPVAHVGAEYQLRLEPGRYHFELFLK